MFLNLPNSEEFKFVSSSLLVIGKFGFVVDITSFVLLWFLSKSVIELCSKEDLTLWTIGLLPLPFLLIASTSRRKKSNRMM